MSKPPPSPSRPPPIFATHPTPPDPPLPRLQRISLKCRQNTAPNHEQTNTTRHHLSAITTALKTTTEHALDALSVIRRRPCRTPAPPPLPPAPNVHAAKVETRRAGHPKFHAAMRASHPCCYKQQLAAACGTFQVSHACLHTSRKPARFPRVTPDATSGSSPHLPRSNFLPRLLLYSPPSPNSSPNTRPPLPQPRVTCTSLRKTTWTCCWRHPSRSRERLSPPGRRGEGEGGTGGGGERGRGRGGDDGRAPVQTKYILRASGNSQQLFSRQFIRHSKRASY